MQTQYGKKRLVVAMAIYAAFAVLAGLTTTGVIRLATWIFLAGLALKTWLATLYSSK